MLALRNGTLIDGTGAEPRAAGTILIDGNRITKIRAVDVPRDARVIDCDGLFLLPGLIDAHTHFGVIQSMDPTRAPIAVTAAQIFRNAWLALDAGITTARDVAGVDGGLVKAIDQGLVRGPRLYPSGPLLCQTGGHGDLAPPFLDHHHFASGWPGLTMMSLVTDGPESVRAAAREAFRYGATQIKMCVSGGVVSITDRMEDAQFTVAEIRAAVEEADQRESYVAAHAHALQGIKNGLAAGVRSFEHGTFLDAETADDMARAGAYLVPTLAVGHVMASDWKAWGLTEDMLPRMEVAMSGMRNATKLAMEAGVRVASGSDLIGSEQRDRALELTLKAEIMGAMGAIVSATRTNARLMGIDDRLGTVEEGKLADIIALPTDPLSDPAVFADQSRVTLVVKDGDVVKDTR